MRLILLAAARSDLESISRFTEKECGAVRKARYMATIRSRRSARLEHPELGTRRGDLGTGYRTLLAGSHAIFYRLVREEIHVVRVLHQRMDHRRHLPEK